MDADQFRALALSLPEAVEDSHMGHPDFRVRGKIFATLGHPDDGHAMVKLTTDQQHDLVQALPTTFSAIPGGWGKRGATRVDLVRADREAVFRALVLAWNNTAPKRLREQHPGLGPEAR